MWTDAPQTLLRCNYIMQGAFFPPGAHTIEFRFQPPVRLFYVSLAAVLLGLVLLGLVIVPADGAGEARAVPPSAPAK